MFLSPDAILTERYIPPAVRSSARNGFAGGQGPAGMLRMDDQATISSEPMLDGQWVLSAVPTFQCRPRDYMTHSHESMLFVHSALKQPGKPFPKSIPLRAS